jgi:hypothetical protein
MIFGLLSIVGCGPNEPSKEKKDYDAEVKRTAEQTASEQSLLADPGKAIPQLVQRLRAGLKMRDGLLIVDGQSFIRLVSPSDASPSQEAAVLSMPGALTVSVFPRETTWVVNCGPGMQVIFGSPPSAGEVSGVSYPQTVSLTFGSVAEEECETLAPAIGKEVQAILNER